MTTSTLAVWMTCAFDGLEHAIGEKSFEDGHTGGVYSALCGYAVRPRSLTAPAGPQCASCARLIPRR